LALKLLPKVKVNTVENLIAYQKFKIQPADKDISDYFIYCESSFNLKNE